MSLTVACACGARFEVQDTYAGRLVECPECDQPVRAGWSAGEPVRTSGLALASLVVALATGFLLVAGLQALPTLPKRGALPFFVFLTAIVAPFISILLAVLGYRSIANSEGQLSGRGYATAGLITTLLFVALGIFALVKGQAIDLTGAVREQFLAGRVKFDGPRKITNEKEGYSITRPSQGWGVAQSDELTETYQEGLLLVHPAKALAVKVVHDWRSTHDLKAVQQSLYIQIGLSKGYGDYSGGLWQDVREVRGPIVTGSSRGREVLEFVFAGKIRGQRRTVIVSLVRERGRLYQLWASAPSKAFAQHESELQRVMDTFVIIPLDTDFRFREP